MNARSNLWDKLARSKKYRHAFVAAELKRGLPRQMRLLRKQRNWTQAELAENAQLTQGALSRAEDPDYGNLTINNILKIAAGFDVAFIGRFVPFSELVKWHTQLSERALEVLSFDDEFGDNNSRERIAWRGATWESTPSVTNPPLGDARLSEQYFGIKSSNKNYYSGAAENLGGMSQLRSPADAYALAANQVENPPTTPESFRRASDPYGGLRLVERRPAAQAVKFVDYEPEPSSQTYKERHG